MKYFFLLDALDVTLDIVDNNDDDDDNDNKPYSMLTRKKQWTTIQETQAFCPSAVYEL